MRLIALSLLVAGAAAGDPAPPTAINEITLAADVDISCDEPGCAFPSCAVTNPTTYAALEGHVTSSSDTFGASYGDPGVFVADGTGGVFVKTGENLGLRVGDYVRVEDATTLCLFGTMAVESGKVAKAGHPTAYRPRQVGDLAKEPGDIAGLVPDSPTYCDCLAPVSYVEGRVITVRGTTVADLADDGIYGYKLFLDDGEGVAQVFIDMNSDVPVARIRESLLSAGNDLCVTGLVARFAGVGNELLPRNGADIKRAHPQHGCAGGGYYTSKSKKAKGTKRNNK